jgi:hypothetical protein
MAGGGIWVDQRDPETWSCNVLDAKSPTWWSLISDLNWDYRCTPPCPALVTFLIP